MRRTPPPSATSCSASARRWRRWRPGCGPVEPLALAGRLDPARVWLATATADQVILPRNAEALARAVGGVGLAEDHWIRRPGNHYTAAFALPGVADLLVRLAEASAAGAAGS